MPIFFPGHLNNCTSAHFGNKYMVTTSAVATPRVKLPDGSGLLKSIPIV